LRFPIFAKILLACIALSLLLLGGSFGYARYQLLQQGRGKYLKKHFNRYVAYQAAVGRSLGTVAETLAQDGRLREALAAADVPDAAPQAPDPADVAADMLGLLRTRLAGMLQDKDPEDPSADKPHALPDAFVVVGARGQPLYVSDGSPLDAAALQGSEAVARLLQGHGFADKVLALDDAALQVAGAAVLGPGERRVLGGLILGVSLERYFRSYRLQSDDRVAKQHRLTLAGDQGVLASVFPRDEWQALAGGLRRKDKRQARDGPSTIEIVEHEGGFWDFWQAPVQGFSGDESKRVGDFFLLRTRAQLKKQGGLGFALALGVVLALVIAAALAYWLTRPLHNFIQATADVVSGEGDLTRRIEVKGNDELTDLADNLNRLFDHLRNLAREVQGASHRLSTSSGRIREASESLNQGARDQAAMLDTSAAAVTELSASIEEIASNAAEAKRVARQSNEAVARAQESMERIRRTAEDASGKIRDLGESSKRIGKIVEEVRKISEQTSLLALNASIEAARAGEQGRGFSVVADEVSSLAREVGQSANNIEELIRTITGQTQDAVRTMQEGSHEVETGTEQVRSTLSHLKQIIEMVEETAGAVAQQAQVSDEIAKSMSSVQGIAKDGLTASEETVIQLEQLYQLSCQLQEAAGSFRTEAGDAGPGPDPARALPAGRGEPGDGGLPPGRA